MHRHPGHSLLRLGHICSRPEDWRLTQRLHPWQVAPRVRHRVRLLHANLALTLYPPSSHSCLLLYLAACPHSSFVSILMIS